MMSDNFADVTDEDLLDRVQHLVSKYEDISPKLSDLLSEWSRTKRELQVITEEIEKRKIDA